MESQFYVNGTDTPPEGEVPENSLFLDTAGVYFRYINKEWVTLDESAN